MLHEMEFARAAYLASWLLAPVAFAVLFACVRARGLLRLAALASMAPVTMLAYARFVEPAILLTPRHDIVLNGCFRDSGSVRLAVFSDAHFGLFPNAPSAARIARAIDATRADAALFAGDWVYHLSVSRFDAALAPFAGMKTPLYSVFGNHDVGLAEPDIHKPFAAALRRAGVTPIDSETFRLTTMTGDVEIVGLTDFRDGKLAVSPLFSGSDTPRFLLSHYPSWSEELAGVDVDLFVAGHTHGGQIYIPGLTCRLSARACRGVRYGLARKGERLLFVTSGTGMVGLPMRFLVPPRIDVLNITWSACGS